jgi:hypothetical protein
MKACLAVGAFVAVLAVSTLFSTARNVEEGGYSVDPCYKRCSSLLSHVTPESEAHRVFHNCMALCNHKGRVHCPGDITVPVGRACPRI